MAVPAVCLEPHIPLWSRIQCHQSFGGSDPRQSWRDELLPDLRRGVAIVQEVFIAYFWPVVEGEASHYGRLGGDFDDLKGEAALALWEAALLFSPGQHRTSFANYVKNHIHRRVRRAYIAQRGYQGGLSVVPLPVDAADLKDNPLSLAEWSLDLKAAFQSLSERDQAALQSPSMGQSRSSRDRKRRQRARRHLMSALKTSP